MACIECLYSLFGRAGPFGCVRGMVTIPSTDTSIDYTCYQHDKNEHDHDKYTVNTAA